MIEASNYFVHLDELMAAVGSEIAKQMGADSAIVTTGCEAAIAAATVACIAGADPERTQALPYAIPLGVLVGTLITLSRKSSENCPRSRRPITASSKRVRSVCLA